MRQEFTIRLATPQDIPVLRELIYASVRGLQAQDYSPEQIESALQTVFGVDSQLISDQTYFVAEGMSGSDAGGATRTVVVGCGGWSKRRTLYGGDAWRNRTDDLLDPKEDAAKI